MPDLEAPPSSTLDLLDSRCVQRVIGDLQPDLIVHAAAYTNVGGAQRDHARCWAVNVVGTRHVAQAVGVTGAKLIHISTDYVFDGLRGGYREDEPPGLPTTYYGLTKLVAEEAARQAPDHLIVRTSFRPSPFPYATAFCDLYTSQDYLDVIAPEIALAIRHAHTIRDDVLHIATERKSVLDLARRRSPEVQPGYRSSVDVSLPADVSLDISRWAQLKAGWREAE